MVPVIPSIPNNIPHMPDWKPDIPGGTGIPLIPSGLRLGMNMNPPVQAEDPADGV